MLKKLFYLLAIAAIDFSVAGAQTITPQEYIDKYKDLAIREMKRMGVPAAITLAQGLLETESGNSDLVKKSNNHFGIKCKSSWTGGGVTHDDDAVGECFRSYKDAEASYRDHSNYLRGTDRYASLFKLSPTDYKGWAKGLRKAGYATNPKYPDILIKNIEQYNLQQYSLEAAGNVPIIETDKYEDDKEPPATKPQSNDDQTDSKVSKVISPSLNTINGHKYINAAKGTSLLAIATENDIDLSKLLAYNDLEKDGILENDQIIFLQKKSKTGDNNFYLVQPQESLYDIAQKNGIQLNALLSYNQLTKEAAILPGTKLYLKPTVETQQAIATKEAVVTSEENKPVVATGKTHAVQPKEGLYSIARKYQVTVQQLKEWNNLTSDDLKIGQELIVSK